MRLRRLSRGTRMLGSGPTSMGRSLMTFRGNWSALSCRWVLMLHRSSPEGVADPYRSTAEIVLTSELFWLRRRCAGRFRVDLPAQGIAAEQGHITIEYCACSFRGKRDHRVSDFLVAELVAYLQTCRAGHILLSRSYKFLTTVARQTVVFVL